MKVLVTTVVSLNPGDAAILRGTVEILKRALGIDAEVVAVDKSAKTAARLYPWMRFVPPLFRKRERRLFGRWIEDRSYSYWLRRLDALRFRWAAGCLRRGRSTAATIFASSADQAIIREYLSADLVLASGGTYLVPSYNLETHLLEYEFVMAIGKPLATMPQSMGPFVDPRFAKRMRDVVSRSLFLLLRDAQSRRYVQDLGVPPHLVHVVPDAAFALCDPVVERPQTCGVEERRRVAVSVRYWPYDTSKKPNGSHVRYIEAVAGMVSRLVLEERAEVTFVSSCQGIPEYWVDDSKTAHEVVAGLPEPVSRHVRIDTKFRDPLALLEELRAYDLVVATRMHVAILAICVGTPVLPIAYEFKTTELFERMGLANLVVGLQEVEAETLVRLASILLSKPGNYPELFAAGRRRMSDVIAQVVDIIGREVSQVALGGGSGLGAIASLPARSL